jgi:prephenate dehydrogenase
MPIVDHVTIVGLGLIGGSLGMAIKRRRLARRVIGVSRRPSTIRRATARRAIDAGTTSLRDGVREADLVILAGPVETIVPLAQQAARFMPEGSVLTDVGSSKAQIVMALSHRLPQGVAFVGGHPIAGSELRGIDAADPALFDRSLCILTPTSRTDPRALRLVRALWMELAGRVVTMSPQRHDQLLGATSHLCHLLAWCLVDSTSAQALAIAPPSFREMTRIAKSDPALWESILLSNRGEILKAMSRFGLRWRALRAILAGSHRSELRRILRHAQLLRQTLEAR